MSEIKSNRAWREECESMRQQLASRDAEIERLKTVPMRYRRLAFNAKLQDESDSLNKQVTLLRDTLFSIRDGSMGLWGDDLINCNKALSATYTRSTK